MPDIFQDLPINAPLGDVFRTISTPAGLDSWWTERSSGEPGVNAHYDLYFGPEYHWRAKVTRCQPDQEFELVMTDADSDWLGTRIGFQLEPRDGATWLHFHHTGWPKQNEHYRVSCNCWAMYLRILRRRLEYGETVPYEDRLNV
jgi:uncharacterized protein YndB with AHSA1/START domain